MADASLGFYRVMVEERTGNGTGVRRVLVLRFYRDGVEAEADEYEMSPEGAQSLVDDVRWLEFRYGRP